MALIKLGPLVGQASGRVGSTIFSHNRGGPYARNGTIPITVQNQYTLDVRNRLSALSQAWGSLGENDRTAWKTWAQANPVVNRLGDLRTLAGNTAFIQINSRILAAGGAQIDVPPAAAPPDALTSLTLAADIGAGNVDLTYTATPLGANEHLYVNAALLSNPGQTYIKNKIRLVDISAGAQASPFDIETAVEERFGTLQVGQFLVVQVAVVSSATGLLSGALLEGATISST